MMTKKQARQVLTTAFRDGLTADERGRMKRRIDRGSYKIACGSRSGVYLDDAGYA